MFDLKYRPIRYSEVVGNVGPVTVLKRRSQDRSILNKSILLGGPKGCGKTTLARIISRSCVCKNISDGEPCNSCIDCTSIMDGSSSSVYEFDAAAHGTVDNIRNIVDNLDYVNFDGNPTILILDEAHRLSPASQDAMLKSMEDRSLIAILCTTEPNKIRPAVRDRVDEYAIRPPEKEALLKRLIQICESEKIDYEVSAIDSIISFNEGSPRSSINSLTNISYLGGVNQQSINTFFRYDSIELLKKSLSYLAENPSYTISEIIPVLNSESPTWVKDTILKLISSSIRYSYSLSTNFPCFFIAKSDILKYIEVSNLLSTIQKPTSVDIELALLSINKHSKYLYVQNENAAIKNSNVENIITKSSGGDDKEDLDTSIITKTKSKNIKLTKSRKIDPIEIDGVKFSPDESLTSVDNKIGSGRKAEPVKEEYFLSDVDNSKVPISDQEFSRAFTEKFIK